MAARIIVALVVVLVLLIVARAALGKAPKEGMAVSPQAEELTLAAKKVFENFDGQPPYQTYRRLIEKQGIATDPVQFSRLRSLHRDNELTSSRVQAAM